MKDEKESGNEQEQKIAQLCEEAANYKELLLRVQADFDNYRKREEKEYAKQAAVTKRKLVLSLLPILDSFEQALTQLTDEHRKGVELLYAQLYDVLRSQGLMPIEAVGKEFDPYLHEVLLHQPSEKDGVILEELQKGYLLDGEVLRHTKVKIGVNQEG